MAEQEIAMQIAMLTNDEKRKYRPSRLHYLVLASWVSTTATILWAVGPHRSEVAIAVLCSLIGLCLAMVLALVLTKKTFPEMWEHFKNYNIIGHDLVLMPGPGGRLPYRIERCNQRLTHTNTSQFSVYVRLGGWRNWWTPVRIGENRDGNINWIKSVRVFLLGPTRFFITSPYARVHMELVTLLSLMELLETPDPSAMLSEAAYRMPLIARDLNCAKIDFDDEKRQHAQTAQRLAGFAKELADAQKAIEIAIRRLADKDGHKFRSPKEAVELSEVLKSWQGSIQSGRVCAIEQTPNARVVVLEENRGLRGFA